MNILVAGGGPIGLATAMLLAADSHDVTVLEKDPQPTPPTIDDAWGSWQRPGVAQWRQAHFLMPRLRQILDAELPAVRDELAQHGATRFNMLEAMPPTVADRSLRDGDEMFETLTARRPVVERAFAAAADNAPGVEIRRGVAVTAPIGGQATRAGVPHVAGVRLDTGEELEADLVIDAMGRRSKFGAWVEALGGRPPYEEALDAGFAYYTRHYRSRDGQRPAFRGPLAIDMATIRILSIPADNDCWTVAVVALAGDQPLKALRHNELWERVVRSFPHLAHWLDGEPLMDVAPMAGVLDRYRRAVVDGAPIVTGLVPVGDSWACTNPTAGRGLSLGLAHAVLLRDVLRSTPGGPAELLETFDHLTEERLAPWYHHQVDGDRVRAAGLQAVIEGTTPPPPPDPEAAARQGAFFAAAARDAEVARAAFETLACLTLPHEVAARPEIVSRVMAHIGEPALPPPPGPDRAGLLALLAS